MKLFELNRELEALGVVPSGSVMNTAVQDVQVNLLLDDTQSYLYIFSAVASVGEGAEQAVLQAANALNAFGRQTDGGQVFLMEGTQAAVFSQRLEVSAMKAGTLEEFLGRFVKTALRMAARMEPAASSAGEVPDAAPAEEEYDRFAQMADPMSWLRV